MASRWIAQDKLCVSLLGITPDGDIRELSQASEALLSLLLPKFSLCMVCSLEPSSSAGSDLQLCATIFVLPGGQPNDTPWSAGFMVGKGNLALMPCPGPLIVLDGARFECPVAPFILDRKDCCWPTGAALWEAVDGLLKEGAVMAEQLQMCGEGDRSEDRGPFIGESPFGWMASEAVNIVSLEVINFHGVLSYKMGCVGLENSYLPE
jgi:hypothetical protein